VTQERHRPASTMSEKQLVRAVAVAKISTLVVLAAASSLHNGH